MVAIVQSARCLVSSFDVESVVIGREMRIRCHAPLHLNREPRRALLATICATEVHRIRSARQASTRYRPCQASQEYLVVARDWHRRHPRIRQRVKRSRGTGCADCEFDSCVGNGQRMGNSICAKRDIAFCEINGYPGLRHVSRLEVCVEPQKASCGNLGAVEIRRIVGGDRARWWRWRGRRTR
jgi:hypothetical protein